MVGGFAAIVKNNAKKGVCIAVGKALASTAASYAVGLVTNEALIKMGLTDEQRQWFRVGLKAVAVFQLCKAAKAEHAANAATPEFEIHTPKKGLASNPIAGLQRVGSALQTDEFHAFPDIVDNYAIDAKEFNIPTRGPGGVIVGQAKLYQVEGSLNGRVGVFEWIINAGEVTHRMFSEGGKANGKVGGK